MVALKVWFPGSVENVIPLGTTVFFATPSYTTPQIAFAGRPFSEKAVNALKFAVIVPFPKTETIVFGSVALITIILPVYDQLLNTKFAGAIALVL